MEVQSASAATHLHSLPINIACNHFSSHQPILCLGTNIRWGGGGAQTLSLVRRKPFRHVIKSSSNSAHNNSSKIVANVPTHQVDRPEAFAGKSGSVSFHGVTHQVLEEGKLESSPFKQGKGSFVWVLAPIALISSLALPQFFSSSVEAFIKDEILAEILASFLSEAIFYFGIATFLLVTDSVQRPYLHFSTKRWGLITGLKGYLMSTLFTTGIKVLLPLLVIYITWPPLGLAAPVAVAPFLFGFVVQYAFETTLDRCGSSCWPLVPIIFEAYRFYQLSKAVSFIQRWMLSMRGGRATVSLELSGALFSMVISFRILGLVCLWSLATFLLRLFPSRPVAEKY